jgi:hypothetical protein
LQALRSKYSRIVGHVVVIGRDRQLDALRSQGQHSIGKVDVGVLAGRGVHVKVGGQVAAGVDHPQQLGMKIGPLIRADLELLTWQRVFRAVTGQHVVAARRQL